MENMGPPVATRLVSHFRTSARAATTLNRKLGGFGAFQNSIDIVSPKSSQDENVRPAKNQSARLRKACAAEAKSAVIPVVLSTVAR
jgi:hypothetical protein